MREQDNEDEHRQAKKHKITTQDPTTQNTDITKGSSPSNHKEKHTRKVKTHAKETQEHKETHESQEEHTQEHLSPQNPNKYKKETGSNETQTLDTTQETHAEGTQENTHSTQETQMVHTKTPQNTSSTVPAKPPSKPIDDNTKVQEKAERKTRKENPRGNTDMKETQETQERKDKDLEGKTETLDMKGKKHIKRKREENTEEVSLLSVKTHHKVVKDKPSHTTVIGTGFGLKQSKLTQKPSFKSKRKANPRLSQSNKINNYFSSVGTIQRGKGEGESVTFDDLNQGVLNQLRHENQPRPRTYIDNGPGS